jgi:putative endonuclease
MVYYVYMLTNWNNKVLYTGVTNNLAQRFHQHKNGLIDGFTKRYKTTKLVYVEVNDNINAAIIREKSIKGLLRIKKNQLVESINPNWQDLSETWIF